ncbi:hypothetical protein FB45DRAFT_1066046 [Roridomyces roridus]|uniref:Uncharacterized protein n=1 Tax=Roridomyces roridus TaxID=1738132 RepID=A0AAD7F9M4_9AGAR|nr:hypothetical protein FB45DRAFT_1066046 [Roridomyces roridus]
MTDSPESFDLLGLKLDNHPLLPKMICMEWARATGPSKLIMAAWSVNQIEANEATVYIMDPPLDVQRSAEYQEKLYTHWSCAIERLVQQPTQADQQGLVAGNSKLAIPDGNAWVWSEGVSLPEIFRTLELDPSTPGIRFIIYPKQHKRKLSSSMEQTEQGSPSKRPREQETLTASKSDDTDLGSEQSREEFTLSAQSLVDHIVQEMRYKDIMNQSGHTTSIPFPAFLGSELPGTFKATANDKRTHFEYRTRSALPELVQDVIANDGSNKTEMVNVVGIQGCGKSHLLAALAVVLLVLGCPVVFLVLSSMRSRPKDIRDAIGVALCANPELKVFINKLLDNCRGPDPLTGLRNFMQSMNSKGHKMVIIALHLDSPSSQIMDTILSMARGHSLYFTADPNGDIWRTHHTNTAFSEICHEFPLYTLPTPDLQCWMQNYEKEANVPLEENHVNDILATTGGVPMLVDIFFKKLQKERCFSQELLEFSQSSIDYSDAIFSQLDRHYSNLLNSRQEILRTDVADFLMAVLNCDKADVVVEMPDRRFMFQDQNGHWRYSNVLAFTAIVRLITKLQDGIIVLDAKRWAANIHLVRDNPSMVGFSTEFAVTAVFGLGYRLPPLDLKPAPPRLSFGRLPVLRIPSRQLVPDAITVEGIYVPMASNFRESVGVIGMMAENDGGQVMAEFDRGFTDFRALDSRIA